MRPLLFDTHDGRLYGCYHPARKAAKRTGVVIAGPHGHDAIRFHRALQLLAGRLAASGHPSLRFDPAGCGDSFGGPELWSLARWRGDLERAQDELRRLAGVDELCLVGLGLGATVACLAPPPTRAPRALVLWDPVVRGSAHLADLRAAHRAMLRYAHVLERRDGEEGEELLGFPLPASFARELAALDLAAPGPRAWSEGGPPPTLLVESHPRRASHAFREELARAGTLRHRTFENPHLWDWTEDFSRVHVPIEILDAIVEEVLRAG